MTEERRADWLPEVVGEIHSLVAGLVWEVRRGAYLEGENVSILVSPCQAEEPERFDVPITVFPLIGKPSALEGIPIVLRAAGDDGTTYYGHLNNRGQVIFRDLELGSYQTEILLPGEVDTVRDSWLKPFIETVRSTITGFLTPLPRFRLAGAALAATHERRWEGTFRTADGSLVTTLRVRESGSLELDFEAVERDWDGALLGFTQIAVGAEGDRPEPKLLFTPLAWSDLDGACRAEVSLGPTPDEYELELPERPWPLESLTSELADALGESVARAATAHTRQAWHRLLDEGEQLVPEVYQAISGALEQ